MEAESKPAAEVKAARISGLKKIEGVLEVLGLAVLLTVVQIIAVYMLFSYELHEAFKEVFNTYFFVFEYFYLALAIVLSNIVGDSLLNTDPFWKMFMRLFFIVFAVNLGYLALSKYKRRRNEAD